MPEELGIGAAGVELVKDAGAFLGPGPGLGVQQVTPRPVLVGPGVRLGTLPFEVFYGVGQGGPATTSSVGEAFELGGRYKGFRGLGEVRQRASLPGSAPEEPS